MNKFAILFAALSVAAFSASAHAGGCHRGGAGYYSSSYYKASRARSSRVRIAAKKSEKTVVASAPDHAKGDDGTAATYANKPRLSDIAAADAPATKVAAIAPATQNDATPLISVAEIAPQEPEKVTKAEPVVELKKDKQLDCRRFIPSAGVTIAVRCEN